MMGAAFSAPEYSLKVADVNKVRTLNAIAKNTLWLDTLHAWHTAQRIPQKLSWVNYTDMYSFIFICTSHVQFATDLVLFPFFNVPSYYSRKKDKSISQSKACRYTCVSGDIIVAMLFANMCTENWIFDWTSAGNVHVSVIYVTLESEKLP